MSSMIDYWGNLGATVGQGVTNYTSMQEAVKKRQRDEALAAADVALKMGDRAGTQQALQAAGVNVDVNQHFDQLDRDRAAKSYETNATLAQRFYQGGNHAQAAALLPSLTEAVNTLSPGANMVGPKFIGTYRKEGTGQEQARPSASMQGPMPEAQRTLYDAATTDWKNPANLSTLSAAIGMERPKPQMTEVTPGASLYTVGPDGKPTLAATAPYPERPAAGGTVLSYNGDGTATVVPKTPGAVVRTKPAAPRGGSRGGGGRGGGRGASGGGAPKPRYGWVNDGKGGKVWAEIKPGTSSPPNPTKPPTPPKARPWTVQDEAAAERVARSRLGIMDGIPLAEKQRTAVAGEVAKLRQEFERQQRQASGAPSKLDQLLHLMDEEKKARR